MRKTVLWILAVLVLCGVLAGCDQELLQLPPSEGNITTVISSEEAPAGMGDWVAVGLYNYNAPYRTDLVFFRVTGVVRGVPEARAGEDSEYCLLKYEIYFPEGFKAGQDETILSCHPQIELKRMKDGEMQYVYGSAGINDISWWPAGKLKPGETFTGGALAFSMRRGDTDYLLEVGQTADGGRLRELPKAFIQPEQGAQAEGQGASYEDYDGTQNQAGANAPGQEGGPAAEGTGAARRAMPEQQDRQGFSYQNAMPVETTEEAPAGLGDWVEFPAGNGGQDFTAMARVTSLTRGIEGWGDEEAGVEYCLLTYDICVPPEYAAMDATQAEYCARDCRMTMWLLSGNAYNQTHELVYPCYISPYPERPACSPEGLIQNCAAVFAAPAGIDGYPLKLHGVTSVEGAYVYVPFV